MNVIEFCIHCKSYNGVGSCWIGSPVNTKSVDDIKALHRNCDPTDMTYEDHLVWERWNKVFNPENYDEEVA